MPYVQKLELEYHFPAYTGLQPRKIEDGGDIAVLRGTEIRVKVVPTMAARGGQVAINEQQQVRADGRAPTARWPAVRGRQGRLLPHRARRRRPASA